MNEKTRTWSILTVVLIIVIVGLAVFLVPGDDEGGDIRIVHTGDTHGQTDNLCFDNAADIRNGLGDGTFMFDTGDSLQGAGMNTITQGDSTVQIMNAAGYDAVCLGPHDLCYGPDVLLERVSDMSFPMLCANLVWKDSGEHVLKEYTILEKAGNRVGVFGIISPDVGKTVKPAYLKDMRFEDPVAVSQRMVDLLVGENVDAVVALGSMDGDGEYTAAGIAGKVDGIDVFLEGGYNPLEGRTAVVGGTLISSPGYGFSEIGIVTIGDSTEATLVSVHTGSDTKTARAMEEQAERNQAFLDRVIGHSQIEIFGGNRAGFVSEIPMGDFAADAMLSRTGADLAFVNGGFVRDSVLPGDVTAGTICDALPFENQTVTVRATGTTILDAIEWGLRLYPSETGAFPQLSGASVVWDPDAEPLHRVISVIIGGEPLNPDRVYTVSTTDYVTAGGDGYTMLALPVVEEYGMAFQTVIDYVESLGEITSLETGRLTSV